MKQEKNKIILLVQLNLTSRKQYPSIDDPRRNFYSNRRHCIPFSPLKNSYVVSRLVFDWFPIGFRLDPDWFLIGFNLVPDWLAIGSWLLPNQRTIPTADSVDQTDIRQVGGTLVRLKSPKYNEWTIEGKMRVHKFMKIRRRYCELSIVYSDTLWISYGDIELEFGIHISFWVCWGCGKIECVWSWL